MELLAVALFVAVFFAYRRYSRLKQDAERLREEVERRKRIDAELERAEAAKAQAAERQRRERLIGTIEFIIRGDHCPGFRIEKDIGHIQVRSESQSEAYDALKLKAAEMGGNAVVNVFVNRQSEREIAGYGARGNPFYKTVNKTIWEARIVRAKRVVSPAVTTRPQGAGRPAPALIRGPARQRVRPERVASTVGLVQGGFVIDGSNLYGEAVKVGFSAEDGFRPISAIRTTLLERGAECSIYFDASIGHHAFGRYTSTDEISRIISAEKDAVRICPGGSSADDFILQKAQGEALGIISNDRYRQYIETYPWLEDTTRCHKVLVAKDSMQVPTLDIVLKL